MRRPAEPPRLLSRRQALGTGLLGATGLTLAGCGGGDAGSVSAASGSSSGSSSSSGGSSGSSGSSSGGSGSGSCLVSAPSCIVAPTETIGPYPAFSGGIVTLASLWRADITTDVAGTYAQRTGVPLTVTLKIVNPGNACEPLAGYDVYIWHCDKDGYYSFYANQPGYLGTQSYINGYFLRGVQTTDACGEVSFQTIFPGWYTGRYTHIHVVVALSTTTEAITQFTFPAAVIDTVYASSQYSAHGANTVTLATDNVFSDGASGQVADTSGSVDAGYTATWVLGVAM